MPSYVKLMDDSVQLFNAKLKMFIESNLKLLQFCSNVWHTHEVV